MEIFIYFVLILIIITVLLQVVRTSSNTRKVFKNNKYTYIAKDLPMTKTEADFFRRLDRLVQERYYVFPQIHLSSILDHQVKGQEWKYAFSHINSKSVDYVLCDKETLKPTYAIELDDYTHEARNRRKRDKEVERIFAEAGFPLVRISNLNISDDEIISILHSVFRQ